MPQTPDTDFSSIWAAALDHAQATGRARPRSVLIAYADGGLAEVKGRDRVEEEPGDTPGPFPAPSGWSFRAGLAAYNGAAFALSGLRYRLLYVLAGAAGTPVRDRELKYRIWGTGGADDRRLKDVAFALRAFLRAELRLGADEDPVMRTEGGYRLALV